MVLPRLQEAQTWHGSSETTSNIDGHETAPDHRSQEQTGQGVLCSALLASNSKGPALFGESLQMAAGMDSDITGKPAQCSSELHEVLDLNDVQCEVQ